MAFCTNCGASVPDGSGFCTYCGAPIAGGVPGRAPAKSGKGLPLAVIIPIAAVLVVGIVLGILFLTGVLGAKGPVGTWNLAQPYNSDGDTYTLVLEKGGTGYFRESIYFSNGKDLDVYFYPVTWDKNTIQINYEGSWEVAQYERSGKELRVLMDGSFYTFVNNDQTDPYMGVSNPAPGNYRLTRLVIDDVDSTSDISWDYGEMYMTVNNGGTGTLRLYGSDYTFTWDRHFASIPTDSDPFFFVYDGNSITVYYGLRELTFTPGA